AATREYRVPRRQDRRATAAAARRDLGLDPRALCFHVLQQRAPERTRDLEAPRVERAGNVLQAERITVGQEARTEAAEAEPRRLGVGTQVRCPGLRERQIEVDDVGLRHRA